MIEEKYSWNKTLKFSWGHIVAFIAIIVISYLSYMGSFYENGGSFEKAGINVFLIDIALLVTFIGAQILKGVDVNFSKSLIFERLLIVLCPLALCFAMLPCNHFWNVFQQRDQIEKQFNTSIVNSKQMFNDYNSYASERLDRYKSTLESLEMLPVDKENYLKTLELQLKSENYKKLETSALEWIDEADHGATVWNAFLIGNVNMISEAITQWEENLNQLSSHIVKYEQNAIEFDKGGQSSSIAKNGLNELKKIYKAEQGFNTNTLFTGIVFFLMLIFPYILQSRDTRAANYYSLIPKGKVQVEKIETTNTESSSDIYKGTF